MFCLFTTVLWFYPFNDKHFLKVLLSKKMLTIKKKLNVLATFPSS